MERKYKKVLLIWPYLEKKVLTESKFQYPFSFNLPIGIAYLAAYLKKEGYEVEVLDAAAEGRSNDPQDGYIRYGLPDDEIAERIKKSKADIVGVSQMFSFKTQACENIFSIVKKIDPKIVTIWGGTHPTLVPEECIENPNVDFLVLGEGEKPLVDILDRLNYGQPLREAKSIVFKDGEGNPIFLRDRNWIENIDDHVLPARELFNLEKYKVPSEKWGEKDIKAFTMISSRGCPYACTFCTAPAFYLKRYKTRAPEKVVDEMEMLIRDHGAEMIVMHDENLTADMARIEKVMDIMIERKIKIKWWSETGLTIAKLNDTLIMKMAQTGYFDMRLALESGDAEMLKTMKKPLNLRKVQGVIDSGRMHGIKSTCFLLMGMPEESLDQIENSVNYARMVGFDWAIISIVLPFPGTQIFSDLQKTDFKVSYRELERYTYPVKGVSQFPPELLVEFRETANDYINFENNYALTRGNIDTSIKQFQSICESYPFLEKAWYYLGLSFYKKGNFEKTLESMKKALDINSEYKNSVLWIEKLSKSTLNDYLSSADEFELNYRYGHLGEEAQEPEPYRIKHLVPIELREKFLVDSTPMETTV